MTSRVLDCMRNEADLWRLLEDDSPLLKSGGVRGVDRL